ncbi:MAG: hypothetical protein HFF34_06195 [Oscillospiraceae bacterium]|nr:hypothetical protein [Oscillospiraceae bacterium]
MFGFVRPLRGELKCKDFDLYNATYCGLCRCLRRRYGLLAPMLLTYDCTFLALLLEPPQEQFTPCRGRCHANPLRTRVMCPDSPALDAAADATVILTWWKLRDEIADHGLWGGLPARGLSILLRSAYRKAVRLAPELDKTAQACLGDLARLEREDCPSIDRVADTFARMLQASAPRTGEKGRDRVFAEVLYHVGRWIYLADAQSDLEEDQRTGQYNPIPLRYGPEGGGPALADTMEQSLGRARAALALADFGCREPVLENILYEGLPLVQRIVFAGRWEQVKKQKIWRKD